LLEQQTRDAIANYYHGWHATVGRANQLTSNLKLGFGLMIALPLLALMWSGFQLVDERGAR
jgi:hypothetical protein